MPIQDFDQGLTEPVFNPYMGLHLSSLSRPELTEWLNIVLASPRCNTILFVDNQTCAQLSDDPQLRIELRHANLLLPASYGVSAAVNIVNTDNAPDIPVDDLSNTLLTALSVRQLKACLLTETEQQYADLKPSLVHSYPNFDFTHITRFHADGQFESDLLNAINASGADVLISVLKASSQAYMLAEFQRKLKIPLAIGLGNQFGDTDKVDLPPYNAGRRGKLHRLWSGCRYWEQQLGYRSMQAVSGVRRGLVSLKKKVKLNNPQASKKQTISPVLTRSGLGLQGWRAWISLRAKMWRFYCRFQRYLKRFIDIVGSGVGLLCLSPLLLSVLALIKVTSPGPIFYSQTRVGYQGKTFRMWKFRSMYTDADARKAELMAQNEVSGDVIFKMKNDPRITPLGRVIRRLSIDELPQLFNVLKGDMSLVGPRPAIEREVAEYPILARARLEAMPGLTGLWQISGRSDLPFDKQILLDHTYVYTQSTSNDLKLIAKTIPTVISGKGAY